MHSEAQIFEIPRANGVRGSSKGQLLSLEAGGIYIPVRSGISSLPAPLSYCQHLLVSSLSISSRPTPSPPLLQWPNLLLPSRRLEFDAAAIQHHDDAIYIFLMEMFNRWKRIKFTFAHLCHYFNSTLGRYRDRIMKKISMYWELIGTLFD